MICLYNILIFSYALVRWSMCTISIQKSMLNKNPISQIHIPILTVFPVDGWCIHMDISITNEFSYIKEYAYCRLQYSYIAEGYLSERTPFSRAISHVCRFSSRRENYQTFPYITINFWQPCKENILSLLTMSLVWEIINSKGK